MVDVVGAVGVGFGDVGEGERLDVALAGEAVEDGGEPADDVEDGVGVAWHGLRCLEVLLRGRESGGSDEVGVGYGDDDGCLIGDKGWCRGGGEIDGLEVDEGAGEFDGRVLEGELAPVAVGVLDGGDVADGGDE